MGDTLLGSTSTVSEIDWNEALENSIKKLSFGRYQLLLLFISGMIYMNYGYENGLTSYIMTIAACDFEMTSHQKGLLNAAFTAGGMIAALAVEILADMYGRKRIIQTSLFLSGACTALASLSQSYWHLLTLRFLSGIMMCAPGNIILTFVAESLGAENRTRIIISYGIFFSIGLLQLPLLSSQILPLGFVFKATNIAFKFNSWRLFCLISGLFPTVWGLTMNFLHESPKFLLSQGRIIDTLEVLKKIEKTNRISPTKLHQVTKLTSNDIGPDFDTGLKKTMSKLWATLKKLLTPPHRGNLILSGLLMFTTMFGYCGIALWLPEVFIRLNNHLKYASQNLTTCEFPDDYVGKIITHEAHCGFKPERGNYVNLFVITTACVFGNIIMTFFEPILNVKIMILVGGIPAGLVVFGMFFVHNGVWHLAISAVFLALSENLSMLVQAAIYGLFPTEISGIACSVSWLFGQAGAIAGNIFMGNYIDVFCKIPLIMMGLSFFAVTVLAWFLPKLSNEVPSTSSSHPEEGGSSSRQPIEDSIDNTSWPMQRANQARIEFSSFLSLGVAYHVNRSEDSAEHAERDPMNDSIESDHSDPIYSTIDERRVNDHEMGTELNSIGMHSKIQSRSSENAARTFPNVAGIHKMRCCRKLSFSKVDKKDQVLDNGTEKITPKKEEHFERRSRSASVNLCKLHKRDENLGNESGRSEGMKQQEQGPFERRLRLPRVRRVRRKDSVLENEDGNTVAPMKQKCTEPHEMNQAAVQLNNCSQVPVNLKASQGPTPLPKKPVCGSTVKTIAEFFEKEKHTLPSVDLKPEKLAMPRKAQKTEETTRISAAPFQLEPALALGKNHDNAVIVGEMEKIRKTGGDDWVTKQLKYFEYGKVDFKKSEEKADTFPGSNAGTIAGITGKGTGNRDHDNIDEELLDEACGGLQPKLAQEDIYAVVIKPKKVNPIHPGVIRKPGSLAQKEEEMQKPPTAKEVRDSYGPKLLATRKFPHGPKI